MSPDVHPEPDAPNHDSRILIVEDDEYIRRALHLWLKATGAEIRLVGTVREGLAALAWRPDIIVLDVSLPDGSGVEIAEAAIAMRPIPRMVATSGSATAAESFRLARLHVREYLPKPYGIEALQRALTHGNTSTTDLTLASALCVGRLGLLEARDLVRRSMTDQAMSLAAGNRTRAADLLRVSRQAVQAVVRTETAGTA